MHFAMVELISLNAWLCLHSSDNMHLVISHITNTLLESRTDSPFNAITVDCRCIWRKNVTLGFYQDNGFGCQIFRFPKMNTVLRLYPLIYLESTLEDSLILHMTRRTCPVHRARIRTLQQAATPRIWKLGIT